MNEFGVQDGTSRERERLFIRNTGNGDEPSLPDASYRDSQQGYAAHHSQRQREQVDPVTGLTVLFWIV
jgi:hypothetical protein